MSGVPLVPWPPSFVAGVLNGYGYVTADRIADGERIIERIAFWSGIPFSAYILLRLASKLEEITDKIEEAIPYPHPKQPKLPMRTIVRRK